MEYSVRKSTLVVAILLALGVLVAMWIDLSLQERKQLETINSAPAATQHPVNFNR